MAKDWVITELKQKIEDDILDENARKSILKLFANVIEKNYDINPSNWNVSYRTGGSGLRFQLNVGHTYILGLYKDCIIVMCEKESFSSLSKDFQNKLSSESSETEIIEKDGILKICGEKCIQVKIPFSKCEEYLETLEPAICDFAKWCTENRKLNPESEDAHVSAFIDYMNQELERSIPQPEYEGEKNTVKYFKLGLKWGGKNKSFLPLIKKYELSIGAKIETTPNDISICSEGFRIVAIMKTIENLKEIKDSRIINDFPEYGILPKDNKVYAAKCFIYDLNQNQQFDVKIQQGTCELHDNTIIEKINELLPEFYEAFDKWYNSKGDSQMTDYEKKLDEIKNNLLVNRNVILTGAPGTGKTFMAKTVAERMGCTENEICFVQFHPSYDYTDFVEGLRPKQVDGSDQIGFERKDGVFKAFCEKALKESYRENSDNVDNFEECWKKLVDELNENDFVTIPLISGKGDFRVELNEYGTGLANRTYENDDYQKGKWIQGKSKFFSKDQLYNIYQGLPGTPAGGHDNYRKAVVEYMKKNLGLLDYRKTESTQKTKKNFVFIIDEINRGEVAKIFGELFYCVDPGYRGKKGRISTQYQNLVTSGEFQKGFFIPENVYIIGTMNDIDRSVESMDFAFRRRFSWVEVKAEDTQCMLDAELDKDLADEAKRRMKNLNAEISKIEDLNDAYHIGASYFLKLNNYDGSQEKRFESLWEYHIKGILQEYLRGNPNGKLDDLKAAYDKWEE